MPLPVLIGIIIVCVVCGGAASALPFFMIRRRKRTVRTTKEPIKPKKKSKPAPAVAKPSKGSGAKTPAQASAKNAGRVKSTVHAQKPPVRPASKPSAGSVPDTAAPKARPVDYHRNVPTVRVDTIFAPASALKSLTVKQIDAASRKTRAEPAADPAARDSTVAKTARKQKTEPETVAIDADKPARKRK